MRNTETRHGNGTSDVVVPVTFEQLRDQLQTRLPSLSPGYARLTRVFLSDPEGCAFHTIGEVAELASVNESSVVRFAHLFGLSGFPAIADLCRKHLLEQAQLVRRLSDASALKDNTAEFLSAIAMHDQRDVTSTIAEIDPAGWESAVTWLAEAPQVNTLGVRKCFTAAYHLAYLLRLFRPGVSQLALYPGQLVEDIRDMRAGDVLVAASIHRYSKETVTAVEFAREKNLHIVALTDNASSPIAALADVTFYIECGGPTLLRSIVGMISVAQALATATAVRLGATSAAALVSHDALLSRLGVYFGEDAASQRRRERR